MSRLLKVTSFVLVLMFTLVPLSARAQEEEQQPVEAAAAVTHAVDGDLALDGTESVEAAEEITMVDSWVNYLRQGGKTMIFLIALSILGMGCALERLTFLRLHHVVPEGFSAKVVALWKDDKLDEVGEICAQDRSMLARVVETILEHSTSTDFQEVKMFAEDKAGRELRLETRKASMLSTVATLSPLLGLFGTVLGLLGAFSTVAAVGEMGDPSILADDISKALVTTVTGLAIAMPALFVYNVIRNRLNLYAVLLEEEVSDLVNNLFVKISR